MPKFLVREFDNDYRALVSTSIIEFETREDADKWCQETSWSGSDYYVDRKIDDA